MDSLAKNSTKLDSVCHYFRLACWVVDVRLPSQLGAYCQRRESLDCCHETRRFIKDFQLRVPKKLQVIHVSLAR